LVEQRTENPRVGGSIPSLAIDKQGKKLNASGRPAARRAELRVGVPVLATIAISGVVLKNQPPAANPLLQIATAQVTGRRRVVGACIVIEQADDTTYCLTSADVMYCCLTRVTAVAARRLPPVWRL